MRRLFIFLSFAFLLTSCEKEVFDLTEEVAIGHNSSILVQTENSGQIEVKYTELLDESRCPPDAICVWPGFVKVQLKLDNKEHVELGLGETTVDSVVYNNHVIKLLSVEYDSDDDFGVENKSAVVIRVD
ncbi:MAG: hypothetical protein AB8B56_02825 [Crocinitomicaceae bacterium]